jgi:integrase
MVTVLTENVIRAADPPAETRTVSSSPRAPVQRRGRRPPEVLSASEVIALIHGCSGRAPSGIRNRALIAVLWRCGLRIGEALALELRDVDLDAATIRVGHGKGDRSRTVGLDEQTAAWSPVGSTVDQATHRAPAPRCSAPWKVDELTALTAAGCCRG